MTPVKAHSGPGASAPSGLCEEVPQESWGQERPGGRAPLSHISCFIASGFILYPCLVIYFLSHVS